MINLVKIILKVSNRVIDMKSNFNIITKAKSEDR